MIKGSSYLKSSPLRRSKRVYFPKENQRERIINLLKVIVSTKNFDFIYLASRDAFLHNNLIIQRFINCAPRCFV